MEKRFNNDELAEALTLLSCYDEVETFAIESILEDINEEVHSSKFLKLISENNERDI